jgi:ABC-type glycerol-3-phosphate transport system substrate-binding protein
MRWRLAALLMTAAVLLSGCSPRDEAPVGAAAAAESPGSLRIVHYIDGDGSKPYDAKVYPLYQKFTEETGIGVEIRTLPWDQLDERLLVSVQSDEALGDLWCVSSQKLEYLVNGGALTPLDEYFNRSFKKEDFLPLALEAGISDFDHKLYLMMQSVHTRGLWYNKKYVTDPPKTLSELVETAQRVMAEHPGVYGLGLWGGTHYGSVEGTLSMLTWANGGKLAGEVGRAAWANGAVADSIRFMSDCVNRYGISPEICLTTPDYLDVQEMFYNGTLAMIFDGSYTYGHNDFSSESVEDYGFSPMPGVDGFTDNFSNGWAWGIPRNAKQKDLAWSFIRWFEGRDVQIEHALIEGSLPARLDALEDEAFANTGFAPQFIEDLIKYGRPMDKFIYYQSALEALAAASSEYCLAPTIDLEKALTDSQNLFNQKYYSS